MEHHREVMEELLERWQLEIDGYLEAGLAINVICLVRRDNDRQYILKTGYPEPELFTEIAVLKHWRGRSGCVQLVEVDENHGVILMERVRPGTSFRQVPAATRSDDIPGVFDSVPMKCDRGRFPDYVEWASRAFDRYRASGSTGHLAFIQHAERLLADIIRRYPESWLLHGDLHHDNMLKSKDGGWVVIDPKGVMGPRVLEYGRFMHNFMADEASEWASIEQVLMKRSGALEGIHPASDLLTVGFIDLTLSTCWTLNDGGGLTEEVLRLLDVYRAIV